MNEREAERYLLELELFGMRFGLDRMHRLMTVLGMPQRRFASIHVVGSNGKSSTARMIAAILERHGLRTGTYTSPHLRSFTERIEIGGRPISGVDLGNAVGHARRAAELVERTTEEGDRVTQFEALTAAAYHELARRRVDVAVVEAGLGGRYDATNVLTSSVAVLTPVSLEHTRWLGSTLAEIAREKLAVLGDHGCLVTAPLCSELDALAAGAAAERSARLVRAPAHCALPGLAGRGAFQRRNFALATAAAEALHGPLEEDALARAAAEVELPGRLQEVARDPLVLHDGAHNPAAAQALAEALPEVVGDRPLTAVLSVLDDKDAEGILAALLPRLERAVLTRSTHPRALPPAALETRALALGGPPTEIVAEPRRALARARSLAGPGGAVLATGSLYLIADLTRERTAERSATL